MKKIFVLFAFISLLIVGCSSGDENNDFGGGDMIVYPDIVESSRQSVDGGSIVTYRISNSLSASNVRNFILKKSNNNNNNIIYCSIAWLGGDSKFYFGRLCSISSDKTEFRFDCEVTVLRLYYYNSSYGYTDTGNKKVSSVNSVSLIVFEPN